MPMPMKTWTTLTVACTADAPLDSAALLLRLRSSSSAREATDWPGRGVAAALSILMRRARRCLRSSAVIALKAESASAAAEAAESAEAEAAAALPWKEPPSPPPPPP